MQENCIIYIQSKTICTIYSIAMLQPTVQSLVKLKIIFNVVQYKIIGNSQTAIKLHDTTVTMLHTKMLENDAGVQSI